MKQYEISRRRADELLDRTIQQYKKVASGAIAVRMNAIRQMGYLDAAPRTAWYINQATDYELESKEATRAAEIADDALVILRAAQERIEEMTPVAEA